MSDGMTISTRVRRAYEEFLAGAIPTDESVRSLVRESWVRSRNRGVDPDDAEPSHEAAAPMPDADFQQYRAAHRLAAVRPLVQSLIIDDIADAGVVVAMTDRYGRLLWVEGDHSARDAAAGINFVEGSVWSEETVGTNAPGLALTVDRGVQIIGPEHFAGSVQNFNCAAAPVHDPLTGETIGVIDVTGGPAAAAPFALAAVRSVVAAVERELHSRAVDLASPETFAHTAGHRLTVLDDGPAHWHDGGAVRPLSPRHAEILLLLQTYPEGLGTEQLATMLSDEGLGAVTVRAEISRLRRDLGDVVASRPYRLTVDLTSDLDDVRTLIASGDLVTAVGALGRGGLLAESLAPGIAEVLDEVREDLRSSMFGASDVNALSAWVASPHGRDDITAWRRLAQRLPASHPHRAVAEGRVRLLDRRFGVHR